MLRKAVSSGIEQPPHPQPPDRHRRARRHPRRPDVHRRHRPPGPPVPVPRRRHRRHADVPHHAGRHRRGVGAAPQGRGGPALHRPPQRARPARGSRTPARSSRPTSGCGCSTATAPTAWPARPASGLTGAGFNVADRGDADSYNYTTTVIRYAPGRGGQGRPAQPVRRRRGGHRAGLVAADGRRDPGARLRLHRAGEPEPPPARPCRPRPRHRRTTPRRRRAQPPAPRAEATRPARAPAGCRSEAPAARGAGAGSTPRAATTTSPARWAPRTRVRPPGPIAAFDRRVRRRGPGYDERTSDALDQAVDDEAERPRAYVDDEGFAYERSRRRRRDEAETRPRATTTRPRTTTTPRSTRPTRTTRGDDATPRPRPSTPTSVPSTRRMSPPRRRRGRATRATILPTPTPAPTADDGDRYADDSDDDVDEARPDAPARAPSPRFDAGYDDEDDYDDGPLPPAAPRRPGRGPPTGYPAGPGECPGPCSSSSAAGAGASSSA